MTKFWYEETRRQGVEVFVGIFERRCRQREEDRDQEEWTGTKGVSRENLQ